MKKLFLIGFILSWRMFQHSALFYYYSIVMLFIGRFTVNLLYYGLSLNTGTLAGNVFTNTFLLGLVEVPGNVICLVCLGIPALGRKITTTGSFMVTGLATLACVPLISVMGGMYYFLPSQQMQKYCHNDVNLWSPRSVARLSNDYVMLNLYTTSSTTLWQCYGKVTWQCRSQMCIRVFHFSDFFSDHALD